MEVSKDRTYYKKQNRLPIIGLTSQKQARLSEEKPSSDKLYYIKYDLQLFAKDGPNGEKTEEPTTKKLTDARKK